YRELCPGRAFSLEVIVTAPRMFDVDDPKFWDGYRKTPAWEFARFMAMADKGQPHATALAAASKEAGVEREREDLEASIRFAHEGVAATRSPQAGCRAAPAFGAGCVDRSAGAGAGTARRARRSGSFPPARAEDVFGDFHCHPHSKKYSPAEPGGKAGAASGRE